MSKRTTTKIRKEVIKKEILEKEIIKNEIIKNETQRISLNSCIAEGSFYKIYKTQRNTVLRISKRKTINLEEVAILKGLKHPFINRMIKWWLEDGKLCFEMELCDFSLKDNKEFLIEKDIKKSINYTFLRKNKVKPIKTAPNESINLNNHKNQSANNTIIDPFSDTFVACSTSIILTDSEETTVDNNNNTVILKTIDFVPEWIKLMMFQISNALNYIHSKRIIHMDIKPENILIKTMEKATVFQLCDFNISRIGEGSFVLDGDKIYMAPEILKNKCFYKSDVYSLGLVYLELVNKVELPNSGEEYVKLRRNDFKGWKIDEIGRRMLERNPMFRCSAKEVEEYFYNELFNNR